MSAIPGPLRRIIEQLLVKSPEGRLGSAQLAAEALRRIPLDTLPATLQTPVTIPPTLEMVQNENGATPSSRTIPQTVATPLPVDAVRPLAPAGSLNNSRPGRRLWVFFALAIAIVTIGGGVLVFFLPASVQPIPPGTQLTPPGTQIILPIPQASDAQVDHGFVDHGFVDQRSVDAGSETEAALSGLPAELETDVVADPATAPNMRPSGMRQRDRHTSMTTEEEVTMDAVVTETPSVVEPSSMQPAESTTWMGEVIGPRPGADDADDTREPPSEWSGGIIE